MRVSREIRSRIERNALSHYKQLDSSNTVNLALYDRILTPDVPLRALDREIAIPRKSVLTFADLAPQYNWAHPCQYWLFDAATTELYDKVDASFPPSDFIHNPDRVELIHAPVQPIDTERRWPRRKHVEPKLNVLANHPGERYAILFSGASDNRHVNDIEFLYRSLLDVYGFKPANIRVLNHNGTLNYNSGPKPIRNWPGDNTPYRMVVDDKGTLDAFRNALTSVSARIRSSDLLFIHTNNHGAGPGDGVNDFCLCTYDAAHVWAPYYVNDFVKDLKALPRFDVLMVMMEQCRSGGFLQPITANSPARWTHVSTAVQASDYSLGGANFDPFAEDWIAGITGHYPDGSALAEIADDNSDGRISAAEAFSYADAVHHVGDTPRFAENPAAAGSWMFLGQRAHDLFLRDNLMDSGQEPLIDGGISCSPDIITYRQQLADPDATLLSPAAQDSDTLGERIEFGQDNYIYLRVQNRGSEPAAGQASVYWTPPTALPAPNSWRYIGDADIPDVPPGEMVVAGPVKWKAADIPSEAHYCFVGLIQSADDPAPDKDAIHTMEDFEHLIRESNNATWKNFEVVDLFTNSTSKVDFHIQGWPRQALKCDLMIDLTELPAEIDVTLRIVKRLGLRTSKEEMQPAGESKRFRTYRLRSGTRAYLRNITLSPSDDTHATLHITIPPGIPIGGYRIAAAQIVDGREVGRVTRLLAVGDYPFLGNNHSHEVHLVTCDWAHKVAPKHKVAYADLPAAQRNGYDGCHYCLPEYSAD